MKVLIVARTRQGNCACIGGISAEGQSVRLIACDRETNDHAGLEYAVGDVWELDARPVEQVIPPHVENIVVGAHRRLGKARDLIGAIERYMPPKTGGSEALYDGLAHCVLDGPLFIEERSGIPPYSTMFWRPDRPLTLDTEGKRIRYRYPTPEGGCTLTFVGFQTPVEVIPAETLLRVSLAHWWRPNDAPHDLEDRCYVQLSGWYLPDAAALPGESQPQAARVEPRRPPIAETDLTAARALLKTVFGYDDFRPLQAQIVAAILACRDTLSVMPTGSGKSLCYQLPALLFDGLTVVVSPLISLMQDQVMQLHEAGAPAAYLNSTLDYLDYVETTRRVRQGAVKLLYTSPETLLRPETLVMLDQSRVACLAIDEAHCISEWGHDFRPEYRQLRGVRDRYPDAVCAAFTATASERVREDIRRILGMDARDEFVASFNRENLYLEVRPRTDGIAQVLSFLEAHRGQSGIIYCSTRNGVERLTAQLRSNGWNATAYHAGMEDTERARNQTAFSRDDIPSIVATIAFGMGINKSNVRFVLHYNLPATLENYYQEIGRAGRDGLRADCLLLFSRADAQTIYGFIEEGAESEKRGRHARLQAMLRYADAQGCRRRLLLEYFDETPDFEACGFCDGCLAEKTETRTEDVSTDARLFLDTVLRTEQIFGASHIIRILRGSRAQEVLRRRHDRLPTYGKGAHRTERGWRRLAEAFIRLNLLEQDMQYGSLRLTGAGRAALDGAPVMAPVEQGAASAEGIPEYDSMLFSRLSTTRRELANEAGVPAFMVFSDRTLAEIATWFPHSPQSLEAIHGIGSRKVAQYGERVLAVVRAYCAENGLTERPRPSHVPASAAMPVSGSGEKRRWEQIGELFAEGRSVDEICSAAGIVRSTVITHLVTWHKTGRPLDPGRLQAESRLPVTDQERVLALLAELGCRYLSPIFDAMRGVIPYEELHLLRLAYLAGLDPNDREAALATGSRPEREPAQSDETP